MAQERLEPWQFPWGSRSLTWKGSSIWQGIGRTHARAVGQQRCVELGNSTFFTGEVINCWSCSLRHWQAQYQQSELGLQAFTMRGFPLYMSNFSAALHHPMLSSESVLCWNTGLKCRLRSWGVGADHDGPVSHLGEQGSSGSFRANKSLRSLLHL